MSHGALRSASVHRARKVGLAGRTISRRGRLVDYGAALEMRFGATRRGFESRPLRHRVPGSRRRLRLTDAGGAEVIPLELGTFSFPEEEPRASRAWSSPISSGTGAVSSSSTPASGSGMPSWTSDTTRNRSASPTPCARSVWILPRSTPSRTATFMPITPGRTPPFPASRSTCRGPSGRSPTRPTTRSWNGSTSMDRATSRSMATTPSRTTSGSWRRPATHPAISRSRFEPAPVSSFSPAKPVTRRPNGRAIRRLSRGDPGPRCRCLRSFDRAAARPRFRRRPVRPRPRSLDPLTRIRRAHRRARYPSQAVLGGELAVPCTCNPL